MTTDMSPAPPSPAPPSTAESGEGKQQNLLQEILSGSWLVSALSIVVALILGGVLIAVSNSEVIEAGKNLFAAPGAFFSTLFSTVGDAYSALFRGAVFDWNARTTERAIRPLTESMVSATPLILTGLGIAMAFRSGLFNIGGQGQVILGATIAGYLGYALHLPPVVHMLIAAIGGIIGGAVWAGIAGVLKARTGANEVIVTIMLNSIAGYLLGYLLKQSWFTHTNSANPQSRTLDDSSQMFLLLPAPFRLHFGFIIAILATIFVWWLLERSTIGFEFKAVGANPHAARTAGISVSKVTILVMIVAGALAGLGGAAQVLGTEYKLTGGISGSIGFDAITVALLGRSKPLGTFFAGLLFGAFKAGGYLMQSQTGTPIDIVLVVQSVIVLLIAAPPLVRSIFRLPTPALKRKEA
ncbi:MULTISPECIES: ABC transporter permease [Brevibacterium]|uniref:Nucleoside ABC transporter membrane protein n=1 Tax=Brevibacterium antiquum CNRZ 918 TaxID=1255637 RepID=A0A2H1KU44_9MICO|nr:MULTISPECIES: ABC transporter permease [Brevibacterium]SMY03064.1 nucleoside ABC transporter membrane protein [Brevibacterium antiquum CNRZ 918]HCG54884.1 ABC transporter permease [Brevibacterium sp.]